MTGGRTRNIVLGVVALAAVGLGAFSFGCKDTESASPSGWKLSMDLDIRSQAVVEMQPGSRKDRPIMSVQLPSEAGVIDTASPLRAEGRLDSYPEAHLTVYTAKFAAKGRHGGPCGEGDVSVALSLANRKDNPYMAGSLTAYCGTRKWYGVPVRVWRLSGTFE